MALDQQIIVNVLKAIREDEQFRLKFGELADSILDKVYSYKQNPNCICKVAIIDWINKNENSVVGLINTFQSVFDKFKQDTTVTQTSPPIATNTQTAISIKPKMKSGSIEIIERTQEAYNNLITSLQKERWIYRGLSVVPSVVDSKEVWTVFFY